MKNIEEINKIIGRNIRIVRKLHGLSMKEVAKTMGDISYQQLQKYEKGENRVSAVNLAKLSKELGVQVEIFFEGVTGDNNSELFVQMLETEQHLKVARYFHKIKSCKIRSGVLTLVKQLSRGCDE